eukprot:Selendium_serpulae@DN58_c0_g1_i2.p1
MGFGAGTQEETPPFGTHSLGSAVGDALSGGVSRAVGDRVETILDSRSCDEIENITEKSQLEGMSGPEYRCLFSRGVAPQHIPLGFGYGTPLNVIASGIASQIASDIWGGKIFMRMWCNRRTLDFRFVHNLVGGEARFPAKVYLGKNRYFEQLASVDVIDENPSMWIDYTGDFSDCESEDPDANQPMTSHFMANRYPINRIVDEVRLIGSSASTGADIYLGRALFPLRGQYLNVAWWSLQIFDTQSDYESEERYGYVRPNRNFFRGLQTDEEQEAEEEDLLGSSSDGELDLEKCVVDPDGEILCPIEN